MDAKEFLYSLKDILISAQLDAFHEGSSEITLLHVAQAVVRHPKIYDALMELQGVRTNENDLTSVTTSARQRQVLRLAPGREIPISPSLRDVLREVEGQWSRGPQGLGVTLGALMRLSVERDPEVDAFLRAINLREDLITKAITMAFP